MKLKWLLKGFFISWLIGLPIYFTNASYNWWWINIPIWQYVQVSDICNTNDNANVWNYITFDNNLNIKYIENGVEYNWFKFHSCGWEWVWWYLYWNNNKLTYWWDFWSNWWDTINIPDNVWYINNVCSTTKWNICTTTWWTTTMSEFINIRKTRESFTIIPQPTDSNAPTYWHLVICFNSTDITYCINYNLATSWSSLWFTHYNPTNIWQAHYNLPITDWAVYFWNSPMLWNSSYTPLPDVEIQNWIPCYTVWQLFESSAKYNTWLCYSSSLQVVGGSLTTVEPQSIIQLFPTYSDFRNSLNLYYNYCQSPWTSESCSDAFSWNYAWYSLISKIPSDVRINDLYDICSMYLTYWYNKNVCELTWTQISPSYYTSEWYAEYIRQRPIEYITPISWTLFDGLVKDWWNSAWITNLFWLEQLFSNIMWFFSEYNWNNWILPGFIWFAFLGFCLFYLFKR